MLNGEGKIAILQGATIIDDRVSMPLIVYIISSLQADSFLLERDILCDQIFFFSDRLPTIIASNFNKRKDVYLKE